MNAIDSLLQDVRSPDPVVRFTVLTRIENGRWSPEEIARLRLLREGEADPATRLHLELILRALEETPPASEGAIIALEKLLARGNPEVVTLCLLLKSLGPADRVAGADLLRRHNWPALPEDALPFILRFLKRGGTREDVPAILECCRHPNPRVVGAAVETLETLSPEDLRGMIVPLLTNPGTGIRSQAMRLLYRWDPAEAVRHFEDLLFSEDRESRRIALFQAFFFPFIGIARSLLRFLSLETDPDLLRQAVQLFIINPDPRIPQPLIDIMEASEAEKKALLQQTLSRVIEFLSKSGVVPKPPQEILADVKRTYREKKVRQILDRCRAMLAGTEEGPRRSAVSRLIELSTAGVAGGRSLLEERLPLEPDPAMRRLIEEHLGQTPAGNSPKAAEDEHPEEAILTCSTAEFDALRTRFAAGPAGLLSRDWRKLIAGVIASREERWLPMLSAALRQGDEGVAIQALKALGLLAPDKIPDVAPASLAGFSPDGFNQALRDLAATRKKIALGLLEQFLFSTQPERRRMGAGALGGFDFPAVRELALKALRHESDPGVLACFGPVLADNGDESLLEEIDSCRRAASGEKQAWLENWLTGQIAVLSREGRLTDTTPEAFRAKLEARPSDDSGRTKQRAPEYAFTEIRKRRATPQISPPPPASTPGEPKGQAEFRELADADPVVRFLALQRCPGYSLSEAQRRELAALNRETPDPFLRFHLDLVLAREDFRRRAEEERLSPLTVAEEALGREPASFLRLILAMETVARPDGPAMAEMLRDRSWPALPAEVLPHLLAFFKRFGRPVDGSVILPLCRHVDPRVVLMAVEALEKINPEELKPLLVPLLVHGNPGIRSVAVRLLYKWDPEEALVHFEANLFSPDREERQAILHFAYFLPFVQIKVFLLRFLGVETDDDLIRKALLLFRVNPLPDVPLGLLDVCETSGGEKKRLIGEALSGVVEALARAGIVARTPAEILADLRLAYREKKIAGLLQQCRQGLGSGDAGVRRAAVERAQALRDAGVTAAGELLAGHVGQESDAALQQELTRPAEIPATPAEAGTPVREGTPAWLDALSATDLPARHRDLVAIFTGGTSTAKCLALRKIRDFQATAFGVEIRKLLKEQPPEVMAAAVEALGVLHPGDLPPLVPRLLEHPADVVKAATMAAYLQVDKKQSLALVEQMLGSGKPAQRSAGIFACGQFDFPVVRDLLLAYLAREDQETHLRQAWVLLRAGLDEALLLSVLGIARETRESSRALLTEFVNDGAVQLQSLCPERFSSPAQALAKVQSDLEARLVKQKTKPPPYALQNIRELRQKSETAALAAPRTPLAGLREIWGQASGREKVALVAIALGFLVVLGYPFPRPPSPAGIAPVQELPASIPVSQQDRPLAPAEVRDIQGAVKESYANGVLVILDGTDEVVFVAFAKPPRVYGPGKPFRAKIKVKKREPNRFEAELLRLY